MVKFEQLFQHLQKPSLWERSAEPFWDDDHISKGMLEAHLNPDWDAASRNHAFIDRSVQWLSTLIPAQGKILDIGCGPGLYAKRLSNMGYAVTGVDVSRRSIAYAKNQDTQTKYVCKNYLELDYDGAFDAILLIYCDYAALTQAERRELLARVFQTLKPGGVFILDVFTEKHCPDKTPRTSWTLFPNGGFWNPGPHACLEAVHFYENNTVIACQYLVVSKDEIKNHLLWNTLYTPQTLAGEVEPVGFAVKGVYNDACGTPYDGEAETFCCVFEKHT